MSHYFSIVKKVTALANRVQQFAWFIYVNRPSNNVPRESERAMSKKKQIAKKDQREAKKPEEAQEGCQCCTEHSTTKIPRTFFVQKL